MNAFQLDIHPFQISQISKFSIIKNINEHVSLVIKGFIHKEQAEEILARRMIHSEISVSIEEDREEKKLLFRGVITELELHMEGNLYEVEVVALSYTCLLEQEIMFRTFQRKGQTCRDIAKEVIESRKEASIICLCGEKSVAPLEVQYQESDWGFLKRIASQSNSVLIPDCYLNKAAVYFGMRDGKRVEEINTKSCKISDCIYDGKICREYILELQIFGVKLELINQELKRFYYLRKPEKSIRRIYYNTSLAGTSMYGKVKRVRREKLQIELDKDKGKQTGQRWFDYATVYSSPDGSGWYCMPEIGDEICLYFPDELPEHAYVLNALHMEESEERKDPENKYIRTRRNQEVRFAPGQIKITNHKGLSVVLDDEKGIEIRSNKDIVLDAGGMIDINSGGSVVARGGSAVVLKQNSNMIAIRNGIREHGAIIERQ